MLTLEEEGADLKEPFRMKDIWLIVTNKGFWLHCVAVRVVLFCRIPFLEICYRLDGAEI